VGNYSEDQEEYLRLLRKHYNDGRFVEWAHLLMDVAPDVAVAHLGEPAIVAASTTAGLLAGHGLGTILAIPLGPLAPMAMSFAGATAGAYGGIRLGRKFDIWYRSASSDERARIRELGFRVAKGGAVLYGARTFRSPS
jgi:hypothetical protein